MEKLNSLLFQDAQVIDIEYMENRKDFTYDKVKYTDLPTFASYLNEYGQKYIIILVSVLLLLFSVVNTFIVVIYYYSLFILCNYCIYTL